MTGSLVIVGSGITAIGQFTLEAVGHLREADRVYYSVGEPATARWILEQHGDAVNLGQLFAPGTHPGDTCVQIGEVMLADVRSGHRVAGVFYGHPGMFVNASHRAIAIARHEGYDAAMLPGISAQDCLFADLGVDPGRPGCQTLEATDLLLYERQMLVDLHVVLFAAGYVGDLSRRSSGPGASTFEVLLDYLGRFYEPDFPFVNYVAAQYPLGRPQVDRVTLDALRQPSAAGRVTKLSTFYFPPRVRTGSDAMAARLGVKLLPAQDWMLGPLRGGVAYGPREVQAVEALAGHTWAPPRPVPAAAHGLYELLRDLALSPALARAYADDPDALLATRACLSPAEREALLGGETQPITRSLQARR